MTLPSESSYILALETAITGGSMRLLRDSVVIDSMAGNDSLSRAEELLPNISSILSNNAISLEQIGRIAVSVGPGSYTGIRIGMASAMGLSTAIGCNCVGVRFFTQWHSWQNRMLELYDCRACRQRRCGLPAF